MYIRKIIKQNYTNILDGIIITFVLSTYLVRSRIVDPIKCTEMYISFLVACYLSREVYNWKRFDMEILEPFYGLNSSQSQCLSLKVIRSLF